LKRKRNFGGSSIFIISTKRKSTWLVLKLQKRNWRSLSYGARRRKRPGGYRREL